MGEIVYREDHYAYELSKAGSEVRVKLLLGPSTTESNVPEGKHHHVLGLSHDFLAEQYEQSGTGPHAHTVRTPIGPEGTVFKIDPNKPSR